MEKQIIDNGYATYALTNDKGQIYGIEKTLKIGNWSREGSLYWSEVYVSGNLYVIIRRGMLLLGKTNEELSQYLEQSKINLHD